MMVETTFNGWLQIALYGVLLILLTRPLGGYMTRVFAGERTALSPVIAPLERAIYRLCGVDAADEQYWLAYALAMLAFSFVGFVVLYAIQRVQDRFKLRRRVVRLANQLMRIIAQHKLRRLHRGIQPAKKAHTSSERNAQQQNADHLKRFPACKRHSTRPSPQ